jgi:tetratricopeptide (TPR) repeat protein
VGAAAEAAEAQEAQEAQAEAPRGEAESQDEAKGEAMTLDDLRALRASPEEHLAAAKTYVHEHPGDPHALFEAACAHDRLGLERQAIQFYDELYRLGPPAELRRRFYVGYGSTLRNVGRVDDAIGVLGVAIAEDPEYPAFHAFLALALLQAGHPRTALATMLGCALDAARAGAFDGYERALTEYHRELLQTRE